MINITNGMVTGETPNAVLLDEEKPRNFIIKNKVGLLQNLNSHACKVAQWLNLISTYQKINMGELRLKIPLLYAIVAVLSSNYTIGSTYLFLHNLADAATKYKVLVKQSVQVTAKEIWTSGIRFNFSPV